MSDQLLTTTTAGEQTKKAAPEGVWALFQQDAARWVSPISYTPPSAVTLGRALSLLYQYRGLRATLMFRIGGWCVRRRIPLLPGIIQRRIASVYGLEIVVGAHIGPGLYIAHTVGSAIGPKKMGANCSVISCVTIGMRNKWDFPEIGDNVFIGAGARVLGGIRIGDGAVIGANAVVIDDVPAGATAVGVPARVVKKKAPESPADQ